MAETATHKSTADEKAEMKAAIKEMFTEMGRLNAVMKQDQEEINRLGDETRAIMANIDATLERLATP